MESVLSEMIARYRCQTHEEYRNALKEIVQDIALLGLWRAKFFEHAAFYGGTALRVLYGLDRFSEDLDFTLLERDLSFTFAKYQSALERELLSFGLTVTLVEEEKNQESAIRSAFLKANTQEHLLKIGAPKGVTARFHLEEVAKIKLEIDTDPAKGYIAESRDLLYPIPFSVRTLSLPSLFAGKLHALLCRGWGGRVKGRDWYDMLWFVQRRVPVRLPFLEEKMRQTGHYSDPSPLSPGKLRLLLQQRIDGLDVERAKEDVIRFIRDPRVMDGWSQSLFRTAADQILSA